MSACKVGGGWVGRAGSLGGVRGGGWLGAARSAPAPHAGAEAEALTRAGQGSRKLEGWWLKVRQFHGLLVKRFHCARRNSKALSSQILLPAFFVCVAMTVALSVPEIGRAAGPGRGTRGPASLSSGTDSSPLLTTRAGTGPSIRARRRSVGFVWDSCLLGTQTPSLDTKGFGKEKPRPGGRW